MTIVDAFNEITTAQGGTPNYSGTIAGAIDALNDALAGSDQPSAQTIEGAVRLLGEHIGGGGSVTVESLTATENKTYTAPEGKAYSPVTVNVAPPTTTVYMVEIYGEEYRQPQGTVSVGGTPVSCTKTSSSDGETVYGYEVPSGSMVSYMPQSGFAIKQSSSLSLFASEEDMVDFEQPLFEATGTFMSIPAAATPLYWVDIAEE